MTLKLACADFTFPLLPHDGVLDLIAALEFDGVDIGLFEGRSHLWPSREFPHVAKSARQLGRKLAEPRVAGRRRVPADCARFRAVRHQSPSARAAAQGARLVSQNARLCGRLWSPARDNPARSAL